MNSNSDAALLTAYLAANFPSIPAEGLGQNDPEVRAVPHSPNGNKSAMRYFHDCGGIHACGPAWDDLGFECVGITEIEKFPIAVVKHHYPNLTQYGDTTKVKGSDLTARIDLLVGGTPCQGLSIAGKRGGLDDPRSNLAWNFLRLAAESNARWIVWENVHGASSTSEGKDLLAFTQEVGKLGYGFAWRTLDAQYFGVPQRRRRIFLVGYFGDWRPAAAVLFDQSSFQTNGTPNPGAWWCDPDEITATVIARGNRSHSDIVGNIYVWESGRWRRATPLECCRLQGFPDHWCQIPWRGKPAEQCPDGPQYKAYGNSIAVPVLRRLGERIKTVSNLLTA